MKKLHLIMGAVFATFLWGSAFVAVKAGYDVMDVDTSHIGSMMLFAGARFFCAGMVIFVINMFRRGGFAYPGKKGNMGVGVGEIVFLAFTQTFMQYFFYYIGVANVTGTKGSIFNTLGTMLTVIFGCIYYKTIPGKSKIAGVFLGMFGVLYMCISKASGAVSVSGEGMLALSAIFSAIGSISNKNTSEKTDAFLVAGWHLFLGGLGLFMIGYMQGGSMHIQNIKGLLLFAYMIFISATAFSIWSWLLKYNPVEEVAVFKFLIPLFGTMLSSVFLGEKINIKVVAALVLVCAGIMLTQRGKRECDER